MYGREEVECLMFLCFFRVASEGHKGMKGGICIEERKEIRHTHSYSCHGQCVLKPQGGAIINIMKSLVSIGGVP